MKQEIDFVITWVDGSDLKWQKDFLRYKSKELDNPETNGASRYRDLGTLKYMFRSFEKFTPWVRKIHFLTYGHTPIWLNLDHPKVNIVRHEEIFPDLSSLPTFNPCAIEMCLHRIPDLTEKFVYFNDDMIIVNPVKPERFFCNNLPNDHFLFYMLFNDGRFSHMLHTTMNVINKEVTDKRKFLRDHLSKIFNLKYGIKNLIVNLVLGIVPQFSLLKIYHNPQPLLKSIFYEVEARYEDEINWVRNNRFRDFSDMNHYLFRFWALIKGKFHPYLAKDSFYTGIMSLEDFHDAVLFIKKHPKICFICFNDNFTEKDFSLYQSRLQAFYEEIFNVKSLFEL